MLKKNNISSTFFTKTLAISNQRDIIKSVRDDPSKKKGAKNMAKTLKHIAVLAEGGHVFLAELKIRKNFTFESNFGSDFAYAMTYSFVVI